MKKELGFLNYYPFEERYLLCEQFIQSCIDWDGRFKEINLSGVSYFDVSDVISLFPHLELDENYKLICYLSREYHGVWGRIAAIKNESDISVSKNCLLFSSGLWVLTDFVFHIK